MKENKEILVTDEEKIDFETATHCFIIDKFKNSYKNEKEAEKYKKVRDHCHFTGKYRGCAHSVCNLNYCIKHFKIPVFFHNMKNYDGHLIIQNAEKLSNKKKIDLGCRFGHFLFFWCFGRIFAFRSHLLGCAVSSPLPCLGVDLKFFCYPLFVFFFIILHRGLSAIPQLRVPSALLPVAHRLGPQP